jgi:ABC-type transport system involved in multi-copper enzyme maturation permease subunit
MFSSLVAELDKSLRRGAVWALGGLFAALSVMFNYAIPYFTYTSPSSNVSAAQQRQLLASMLPEQMIGNQISGFPMFGGAIALILGALLVGSEYNWNTLKTLLTQHPGRLSVLSGKLVGLAAILCGFVLAVFAAGALSSYIVAEIEGAPVNWPSAGDLARALSAGWFILAVWAALGVALATLSRGTALAVGLGLVYVLVIENLVRGFGGLSELIATISKALPGSNAASLAAAAAPSSAGTDTPGMVAVVGGTQAALVLAAYATGFVLLSALLLLRRDVA